MLATGFGLPASRRSQRRIRFSLLALGPTGICTLLCVLLKKPRRIIVCEKSPERARFVRQRYPEVLVTDPKNCKEFVLRNSDHGGADVVLEVAGSEDTFRLAWDCAVRTPLSPS